MREVRPTFAMTLHFPEFVMRFDSASGLDADNFPVNPLSLLSRLTSPLLEHAAVRSNHFSCHCEERGGPRAGPEEAIPARWVPIYRDCFASLAMKNQTSSKLDLGMICPGSTL